MREENHGRGALFWVPRPAVRCPWATEATSFVVKGISLQCWQVADDWAKQGVSVNVFDGSFSSGLGEACRFKQNPISCTLKPNKKQLVLCNMPPGPPDSPSFLAFSL